MLRAISILCVGYSLLSVGIAFADDDVSEAQVESGFEQLINAQLDGWKHTGNWRVEDGEVTRAGRGGSLVYVAQKVPDDFELRFEWKVAAGSNSGVYYRPGQYEYQILDNAKHADGKNPRTSAASLYFCMAPSEDATRPVGAWNTARIICKGSVVQHWLNGTRVISFDYQDPKWAEEVELLRLRGGDVSARGAYLSIQDHGDPVWYRNIRWRQLRPEDEIDDSPVTPAEISADVLKAERKKLEQIIERRQHIPRP